MQNILYIYYRYIVKSVYGDIQCTYIISTSLYTLYTLLTIQTSVECQTVHMYTIYSRTRYI